MGHILDLTSDTASLSPRANGIGAKHVHGSHGDIDTSQTRKTSTEGSSDTKNDITSKYPRLPNVELLNLVLNVLLNDRK